MSCRTNYFMGTPAKDVPSQKVVVTDRLAASCGVDTSYVSDTSFQNASTGGIVYVKGPRTLAATGPGDYGLFLTSNGGGEPFWSAGGGGGIPIVVGPTGTILRSDGTEWVASTSTFADTYTEFGVLFADAENSVINAADFLWNPVTKNLQLGADIISIGNQAGQGGTGSIAIGTLAGNITAGNFAVALGYQAAQQNQQASAVAIGNSAGQVAQSASAVAIGVGAGQFAQFSNAVSLGNLAGNQSQRASAVAIGISAGQNTQGDSAVAIGNLAGQNTQAAAAVAIGSSAGLASQGANAVAIGVFAGRTRQGQDTVAIGNLAGAGTQGVGAVAIGLSAGQVSQGSNAIAIGNLAGQTSQTAGSICLNASGAVFNPTQAGFYVNPVRTAALAANAVTLTYSNNEVVVNSGKTFVIDHPKKPETHYLVHACLEGPEAGVYYRGKARIQKGELNTVVELPAYAHALADRFTIQVTPIDTFVLMTTSRVHVNTNTFVVSIPAVLRHDLEFFWLVMGQRETLEAEISKEQATVMGQGPYRWLIKK